MVVTDSYQRITSILRRFSASIEETRISLRSGNNSLLGYGLSFYRDGIEESAATISIPFSSPFLW